MRIIFYLMLLASVVALAFLRGRRDEKIAAAICVAGTALTVAAGDAVHVRYSSFNPLAFAVDFGVLLAFLALALRSQRFWPLWVAGLQLSATSVHLMFLTDTSILGRAFGAALAFWSYPILLLIGIGALRTAAVERWRDAADVAPRREIT